MHACIFIHAEFYQVNHMSSSGYQPMYYNRYGRVPYKKRTAQQMAYPAQYAAAQKRRRLSVQRQTSAGAIVTQPAAWQPVTTEIKAVDGIVSNYLFRTPPNTSIALLNGIQTGAAFYNRVGSRVEMKNLHLRGYIQSAATSVTTNLRMLVVYDRQPTGALPVVSDILQSRDQTGATATNGDSEINLDNRDRFIILRDKQYYAPPCTNTAGVLTNGPSFPSTDQEWDINEFIKLKGLGVHFKSSSSPTTVADIATGAVYVMFVSTTSDSCWNVNLLWRTRFYDK